MWGNAPLAAALDKGAAARAPVRPYGESASSAPLARKHLECGLPLCAAAGMGDFDVHHRPVAVVHEDVAHVAQAGLVPWGFLVGICRAGVGVVAAAVTFEVDLGVAPPGVCLSSLRLKLLCKAQASMSVPSTLKGSSPINFAHCAGEGGSKSVEGRIFTSDEGRRGKGGPKYMGGKSGGTDHQEGESTEHTR